MIADIQYFDNRPITPEEFIDVLTRSTLSERRPVSEPARVARMLEHANVLVTAWSGDLLVGVSRALSDFSFCCYLSDLAVDEAFQHKGIGKELIRRTHIASGEETTLILLAAPKAIDYYPKIGMVKYEHCFKIDRTR
jgi:GNAT superfamily N-acetyltransferase